MRYDLNGFNENSRVEEVEPPAVAEDLVRSDSHQSFTAQLSRWLGLELQRIVRLSILLILFGLLALGFMANFRVVVVEGHSMEPTYSHGQRVLMSWAYWLFGPIRKGDVVVIELPGGARLIKRVVAMGGEEVPRLYWGPAIIRKGRRVPPGYVYVVGDNMEHSEDSRQLGPFPLAQVRGKIIGGYKPLP